MTDTQLYLAVGLPMLWNGILFSVVMLYVTSSFSEVRKDIREIRDDIKLLTSKVAEMDTRLSVIEERMK